MFFIILGQTLTSLNFSKDGDSEDMGYREVWQNDGHSKQFGKAIREKNTLYFLRRFKRYLPARCLNYVVNSLCTQNVSILDVGCAAGDFYAYLASMRSPGNWTYEGVDISTPAIEIARKHFGKDLFQLISKDDDLVGKNADIILSVDVLIHQVEPFQHLERIFDCARKLLVVSLRTREIGDTVLDPELSCQINYGQWAPFIVFNINQLYKVILGLTPKPLKLTCFKEYKILGGENKRFLPKDLYTEDPKTAITTLLIEKCENGVESKIEEYEYMSIPMHKKRFTFRLLSHFLANMHLDKIIARKFSERIVSIEEILKYTNIMSRRNINANQILE